MPQVKEPTPTEGASPSDGRDSNATPRLNGVRVLVVFGGSGLFGHERANLEVFRNAVELGAKVRFLTGGVYHDEVVKRELQRLGFEWVHAPFGYLLGKSMFGRELHHGLYNLYSLVACSFRLWKEVRSWQPTHIYVTNWRYFFFVSLGILTVRTPLIYRAGDCLPRSNALHRWINAKLFARVARMVCNSDFVQRSMLAAGMPRDRTQVIHNHPPQRPPKANAELPATPAAACVIVYLGQLSEHKGVLVLVDAFRKLLAGGADVVLWLAGQPAWTSSVASQLKETIQTQGFQERVHLLGHVENVRELLQRTDIHICPSLFDDPSPNVILEAKREGVPSVVFPVGGLPELIDHQVDGYVCSTCTPGALADGIDYFLQDVARRKRAGEAARRSLDERFGFERFRRQWAEVFLETFQKPTSRNDQLP